MCGWNLISLAVTAADLAGQFQQSSAGLSPVVGALFRWNPATRNYSDVLPGQTVPAGSVLWVRANTNATLAVTGAYLEPANQPLPAEGGYVSSAGLEGLPLQGEGAVVRADVAMSHFDPFTQHWDQRLPSIPFLDAAFPKFLPPGAALFARADLPAELTIPDATLRIRYYHQDHLGSSSVMTDADGALVEETAFYPFGIPRHEHRLRPIEEPYRFTQKERDQESGLHYFEARFLTGLRGRFLSADPKYADAESAGDPQAMNLYAYVRNNPLQYSNVVGPRVSSVDMTVMKEHKLSEKLGLEIRLEAYNMLNSFFGADPTTDRNSSLFGRIANQRATFFGRQVQYTARLRW